MGASFVAALSTLRTSVRLGCQPGWAFRTTVPVGYPGARAGPCRPLLGPCGPLLALEARGMPGLPLQNTATGPVNPSGPLSPGARFSPLHALPMSPVKTGLSPYNLSCPATPRSPADQSQQPEPHRADVGPFASHHPTTCGTLSRPWRLFHRVGLPAPLCSPLSPVHRRARPGP